MLTPLASSRRWASGGATTVDAPRAILGVGNVLMGDEGVGVHAIHQLLRMAVSERIMLLDGGTEGLGLMEAIVGLQRLVIIDCVRAGHAPGTVFRFDWGEPFSQGELRIGSSHEASVADVLRHVALLGPVPRTTVVGVEPSSLALSIELSTIVAAQLDRVCALALAEAAA